MASAMESDDAPDSDTSQSPKKLYKDPDDGRQRFLLELEFIQCLANPTYIHYGRHGGDHGRGGSYRQRDYHRKRHRKDDRYGHESSKRSADYESRENPDHDARMEKNPRFRESGDSDEEDDDRKRRP